MQILLGKIDKRANDHQRVELKIVAGQIGPRGPPGPVGYPGPKGFEVRLHLHSLKASIRETIVD